MSCANCFASTPGNSRTTMAFTVSIVPVAPDERADSRRAAAGVRSNCSFCASRSVMNIDRIAARGDEVAGQSDDGERVAPKLDLLAERKPRAAIRDRLVAAAQDRPAFDHVRRFARPRDLRADDEQPQRAAAMLRLDVLIGDAAGRRDAPLGGHGRRACRREAARPRRTGRAYRLPRPRPARPAARTSPSDSRIRPR